MLESKKSYSPFGVCQSGSGKKTEPIMNANYQINSKDLAKILISRSFFQKGMLDNTSTPVTLNADFGGFSLESIFLQELAFELHKAISARALYAAAENLPLEDLFFVANKLQKLIRKAEDALHWQSGLSFPGDTRVLLRGRVDEARDFRQYIIQRIRSGF